MAIDNMISICNVWCILHQRPHFKKSIMWKHIFTNQKIQEMIAIKEKYSNILSIIS